MIITFRELLYLPFVTNLRCIHNQAMLGFFTIKCWQLIILRTADRVRWQHP